MNDKLISSNQLTTIQFYGIIIRLDAILIEGGQSYYCVTCRTSSRKDETTNIYEKMEDAQNQFNYLLHTVIHSSPFFLNK